MKKFLVFCLSVVLGISMTACTKDKAPGVTPTPAPATGSHSPSPSQTPGNSTNGNQNGVTDQKNPDQTPMGNVGDAAGDLIDGAGDVVGDAAHGIGDAARDLTGRR